MAKEIERKFLVINDSFLKHSVRRHVISQGYISVHPNATVRVRIKDDSAWLTVKGLTEGVSRNEWEYKIPYEDGIKMLNDCCSNIIYKTRYIIPAENGSCWEVDVFEGNLKGLVLAEIEISDPNQSIDLPPFLGSEVSLNPSFFNSSLASKGLPRDFKPLFHF